MALVIKKEEKFRFIDASSEYLSGVDNLDLTAGEIDFSLPLLDCGVTEIKKKEKRCSRCKFLLPLTDFYVNNTLEDKLQRRCKICEKDSKIEMRQRKQDG